MNEEDPSETPAPEAEAPQPVRKPRKPLPMWAGAGITVLFLVMALGIGYLIWILTTTYNLGQNNEGPRDGRMVSRMTYEDPLGWGSELLIDKKPDKPARIRFLLRDKNRKPVTDATVSVLLVSADDQKLPSSSSDLVMSEPGVYRGEVKALGGTWDTRIRVKQGDNAYQVSQRVTFPKSTKEKADEIGISADDFKTE